MDIVCNESAIEYQNLRNGGIPRAILKSSGSAIQENFNLWRLLLPKRARPAISEGSFVPSERRIAHSVVLP